MHIGESQDWREGEEDIWDNLSKLDPADVVRRAKANYDPSSSFFTLSVFNEKVHIHPKDRIILGNSPVSDCILNKLGYISRLSILWYLAGAKDLPASGELVNPANMSEGQIFFKGSHELPLFEIAQTYDHRADDFLNRGTVLGGRRQEYGDASF